MSIDQYSSTPASNDLSNYFKTGMRPSAVKNAGWDMMANLASYSVSLPTAGGTANALTVSNGRAFGSLVTGLLQILTPANANTGPATFAPDGLTAANVSANGAALAGGEMQPSVPAFLKYDGTQWNLLNPALPGKNFCVDPCSRVAQGAALTLVNNSYGYGLVDLVQGKVSGTAVSAGTLTQDTAGTVAAAATPYSTKIAGLTVTGTGKVFFRRWIESRDSAALNGQKALFSVLCRHDVGSNINAFLTVNKFNAQDNPGAVTALVTGAAVSAASGTDTAVTAQVTFGASDGSNGIEVILEMDCGAVTAKDLWATDWQACIKTLAQRCVVPRFEDDLAATLRYFEKSYELGTAPGTVTNNGMQILFPGSGITNGVLWFTFSFKVLKLAAPATMKIFSPATGTAANVRDQSTASDKAITHAADQASCQVTNNSGGVIGSGDQVRWHFTADARL